MWPKHALQRTRHRAVVAIHTLVDWVAEFGLLAYLLVCRNATRSSVERE